MSGRLTHEALRDASSYIDPATRDNEVQLLLMMGDWLDSGYLDTPVDG